MTQDVNATNANAGKMCTFGVCKMQIRLKWQSASEAATANKCKCQIMMGLKVNAMYM